MADQNHKVELQVKTFVPSSTAKLVAMGMAAIGVITLGLGMAGHQEQFWPAYLVSFFFFTCLGLGGLFFAAINNIAQSGWSSSIRRISEGLTSFLPAVIAGSLILVLGLKYLYPWANPEQVSENAVLGAKTAYLNPGFLILRLLIFSIGSFVFAQVIVGNSLKQDKTGNDQLTRTNVPLSIAFVLFFAISFSLFSVDVLMSLSPSWYSTIFGVYTFSGLFQSSMAVLILLAYYLQSTGTVKGYINDEHIHDMAKYLKGFTVFWAYIGFSQFMLIWYANIPEETEFYLMRSQGGWMAISVALLIFRFIVPFIALLPRWAKRTPSHLKMVCYLVIFMQYVDIFWMVYPNFNDTQFTVNLWQAGTFLGFFGVFLLLLFRFFNKNSVVAIKDPRMQEALAHHVTY